MASSWPGRGRRGSTLRVFGVPADRRRSGRRGIDVL
jgi:hypothetical protein